MGVIFKEPGYLDENYIDLHNPTFFLRKFISYFCGNINGRMHFNDRKSQIDELNIIKTKNEIFKDRIQKFKYLINFDEEDDFNSKFIDNKNKSDNDNLSEFSNNNNIVKTGKSNENLFQIILNFENEYIQECTFNSNYSTFYNKYSLDYGCGFCLIAKPRRAHHCRMCKKCIKRMDHHCYILCSCVGYNNYKQFFLLLLYSSIMHILVIKNSIRSLGFYFYEYRSSYYLGFYIFYLILTISIGIMLIIFFIYHF